MQSEHTPTQLNIMPILNLNQHMQRAVELHQTGNLAHAETMYLEALTEYPRHGGILNLLGTVCAQQEKSEEALKYLHRALRREPDNPLFLLNLGEALVRANKPKEAISRLKQALHKSPQLAAAHYNLGNVYKTLEQPKKALQYYKQATRLEKNPEYFHNYANLLWLTGDLTSAIDAYHEVLSLNPQHVGSHNNLGALEHERSNFEKALYHYQQAALIDPHVDATHNNLFQFYKESDQKEAAIKHLTLLKNLRPTEKDALDIMSTGLMPIIPQHNEDIDEALERMQNILSIGQQHNHLQHIKTEDLIEYNISFPWSVIYYGRDDRILREQFAEYIDQSNLIPSLEPFAKKRSRPRIGFVVTKGHEGVFLKCMAGLISLLPETYETWIVCSEANGRKILTKHLPECNYLSLSKDLLTAAQQLQKADFDLLYYWEIGTDSYNYFLPFFKTARLQVTSWGWPVTSGIKHIDAFISAHALEPENAAQYYSEHLILCDRLPIYYNAPPVPQKPCPDKLGINPETHVYLCTQNLRKIQPDMHLIFNRILEQDPRGHLFFIADKRMAITERFHERLHNLQAKYKNRIHILKRMQASDYLRWVKSAHVILDTTCYTGGANTNYDAFQAGTPVVTLAGPMHRSRFTLAAYTQMGYTDCVTYSPEDYVSKAVALACDTEQRQLAVNEIVRTRVEVIEDKNAISAFCSSLDRLLQS